MKIFKAAASLAAMLLAAVLALAPAVSHAQKGERYKVVFQVSDNDPAKWNLALNNANNVLHDLGKDNVDIEIVAYGPGLNMLKSDSKVAPRLAQALDQSVGLLGASLGGVQVGLSVDLALAQPPRPLERGGGELRVGLG